MRKQTDPCDATTGINSVTGMLRWFHHYANILERISTNPRNRGITRFHSLIKLP